MSKRSVLIFVIFCSRVVLGELEASFSPNELKAIGKLREQVSAHLYKDYMQNDHYLMKFLRAQDLNVNEAKEMLINTLKWRKENRIDTILQENLEIKKLLPYELGTFDNDGRPVGALRIGEWKARHIILAGKRDHAVRGIYSILELLAETTRNVSELTGKNITKVNVIVDLSGYNTREHACLLCVQMYYDLFFAYENYYPESFKTLTVVNTPRIFQSLFVVIKPLLSNRSQAILTLYGFDRSEWIRALLKIMPKDQIPKYISIKPNLQ